MDFKTSYCYNHKIVKEKSFLRKYDTKSITLGGNYGTGYEKG